MGGDGRTMRSPLDGLSSQARDALRPEPYPTWVAPMLATLTDRPFSRTGWIFERKLDGERVLAFRRGSDVRLLSRNRKSIDAAYPEVAEAIASEGLHDEVLDGEVVAFVHGVTSFSALQPRMQVRNAAQARVSGVSVYYYVFDLLHLDGYDTTGLPLLERKQLLRGAVRWGRPLRFTTHRATRGTDFLPEACEKGWEGLIAKRADAPYQHRRSTDWLKLKCSREQEFVVGGFTDPKGSRIGFGALLLGYYEGGKLRYAGDVGTGFDRETLSRLRELLSRLERDRPPFERDGLPRSRVHWVRPDLVAEVAFSEWTRDGKLRHPRFKGLRRDKRARDVVRELP
jgi:bifunctional non-homologous end joining protein LigD